jgi:hypothetical protein
VCTVVVLQPPMFYTIAASLQVDLVFNTAFTQVVVK